MKERKYLIIRMPTAVNNQLMILDNKTVRGKMRFNKLTALGGVCVGSIKSILSPDELFRGFRALHMEKAAQQNGTLQSGNLN